MGASFCKKAQPLRILFWGMHAVGKTTLLYRLLQGELVQTSVTLTFNLETVNIHGCDVKVWDIGGRDKTRPLYRHYMHDMTAMVYIVDSTDREKIHQAFEELDQYFLSMAETQDKVCMVLANKQDLSGAMTVEEVKAALQKRLDSRSLSQSIFVCPCSAHTGEGMREAFRCLMEQVELKRSGPASQPSGLIDVEVAKRDQTVEASEPGHWLVKRLVKDPASFLKSALFY